MKRIPLRNRAGDIVAHARIELLAADARRHATQVCDESETKETVG